MHITALYAYQVRVAEGLGIEIEADKEEMSARLSFGDKVASKSFGSIALHPGGKPCGNGLDYGLAYAGGNPKRSCANVFAGVSVGSPNALHPLLTLASIIQN